MQLTVIALIATVLFFLAFRLPQIISSTLLLVIIPIQPVDTQYASANVLLAYVIFIALLLRGENIKLPMLPQFLFLLFCYFLSMSFVHQALYVQHAIYMVALVSAYLVLCIAYDLTLRFKNLSGIVGVFIAMNIIVAIYCIIQIDAGPGVKVIPFGINEMAMIPGRNDNRLTGPFDAVGVAAEYFVIMIFLILHRLLFTKPGWHRYGLIILAGANLAFLVATGNRGGFLSLLGGGILFLWFFRKELGARRIVQILATGASLLALMSILIVNYTDFGQLYERLADTSVEEGIPDTRQETWPLAIEKIKERPIFGHGPRYMMYEGLHGATYPGWEYQRYPHNLYLFLLATVGIVGLIAFMTFMLTPLVRCWKASSLRSVSLYHGTLIRTGIVIFLVIIVDQMKVEFMRIALVDYWHFVFALLGVFVAVCDRAGAGSQPNQLNSGDRGSL